MPIAPAALEAALVANPKAPVTPLVNSQEPRAKVVAQRIAPFKRAVERFIGPQPRAVTQPPVNREINKAIIDQSPTLPATSPVIVLGLPELATVSAPIAANSALKIS